VLHHKSWKGSTQGYRSITIFGFVFFLLTTSFIGCKGMVASDNEDVMAQKFASNIDSAKITLSELLAKDKDTILFSKGIKGYYQDNGMWLWASSPETLEQCDTIIRFIEKKTSEIGFNKNIFLVDSIKSDISRLKEQNIDSLSAIYHIMARLELNLSKAYLSYVAGQCFGFVNPYKVFNRLDRGNGGGYRPLFDVPIELPDSNFVKNSFGHILKEEALDYLSDIESKDEAYIRLKDAYMKDSISDNKMKLLLNMERCRWKIKDTPLHEKKHIFVNIPAQHLWAVQPDSVLSMRICCGAFRTKTPMLTSKVNLVQFNPEWGIPMSIIKNEVSGHAGDSSYFARHRYSIIHKSGDTINPKDITSAQLRNGNYRISQKSGPGNSLGRIIFRFPNQFSVYLHDTNSPGAFRNEKRTISHGCVRVQQPFDLAMFVLPDLDEWTIEKIRLSVDIKPQTDRGKKYLRDHLNKNGSTGKPIRLINSLRTNPETPLYIGYYTAYPNPQTRQIEFWPDRYEYDKQLLRAIKPLLP